MPPCGSHQIGLALESHAQLVDLLLQIAGTHALDHVGAQAQPCALHVQIGLAVHHYAIALLVVARHLAKAPKPSTLIETSWSLSRNVR